MNRKCGVRNTQCNAKSALFIAELKKFYAAYGWPIFYCTSLIILLLLFFIELECWFGINVWRHDEVYYLPDYWAKFCEEGRWLNFILFPALRIFPAHLAITLCYCCLFYYAFTCAKPFIANKNALLFGLAALQVCSLYDLLTWPVISLPSFLALAGFTFLKERLDWRAVFLLGGIIFSGGFNNFYNLLPLLYLREIYTGKISLLKLLVLCPLFCPGVLLRSTYGFSCHGTRHTDRGLAEAKLYTPLFRFFDQFPKGILLSMRLSGGSW